MKRAAAAFCFAFLSATATHAASGSAKIAPTSAASKVAGDLTLKDTDKGLLISGTMTGLTPGKHGFHIHEFGGCSDEGKAAGSHYDPGNHPHGNALKDGHGKAHVGDMGNLEAGEDGIAAVNVTLTGLSLSGGKANVAGRAFIIHEKSDDFSQPVGNAGGRVGCGHVIITGN